MCEERTSKLLEIIGEHLDQGVLIFKMKDKSDKKEYIKQIRDDLIELGYCSTYLINQDDAQEHHVLYRRINKNV